MACSAESSAACDIRGRDFRMNPDSGAFETVAGLTQHGRVRDDWGHWFGCDNGSALFHYPLHEHYARRNPQVATPPPSVNVPAYPGANRIFPISRGLERFNEPAAAGHVTSGCGIAIYRDTLLAGLNGNAFACEPVHNLVHREVLATDGVTFTSQRADDEKASEFLASTDNWFRPVQARTGPDGALYIVDMYRFLIEHPRWITAERLAQIDARAGAEMGRIYRVVPKGHPLRAVRDLTKLDGGELAAALDTPNGTERDRVHLEALARSDPSIVTPLAKIAHSSPLPEARVQALCLLDGIHALTPAIVATALSDTHPRVREQAVRLSEKIPTDEPLRRALASDPDRGVRYQVALTLGESDDPRAGAALATLAASPDAKLPYFRAALLSSAPRHPSAMAALEAPPLPPAILATAIDTDLIRLRADPSATAAARAQVLQKYQSLASLPGIPSRGAEVFARACALCHAFAGVGFDIGPNLGSLRDKPVDYWLKNILDPSAAIEPRFISYIIEARDGRTFTALLRAETATSHTLAQPGGIVGTLLRTDVRSVKASKTSLMPEGLEQTITPQDMADLLAFLHPAPKNLPGNKPEPITPAAGRHPHTPRQQSGNLRRRNHLRRHFRKHRILARRGGFRRVDYPRRKARRLPRMARLRLPSRICRPRLRHHRRCHRTARQSRQHPRPGPIPAHKDRTPEAR